MRVMIRTQGLELSAVGRECAEQRLTSALGRAAGHVRSVTVFVADENGPKGGVDKTCRVAVNLDDGPPVVVRHRAAGVGAAVGGAAERVGRAVARALDRLDRGRRERLVDALRRVRALFRRGGKGGGS
jgi:putative sigma-54 modulation protein